MILIHVYLSIYVYIYSIILYIILYYSLFTLNRMQHNQALVFLPSVFAAYFEFELFVFYHYP